MLHGPIRLSLLSMLITFGAIGLTLALTGAGLPFAAAAVLAAAAAGLVQFVALRAQPGPDRSAEQALLAQIETQRSAIAALRHDIRGVISPALMMTDRLLNHADPAVQKAGQVVVRSIDRATALLTANRDTLAE